LFFTLRSRIMRMTWIFPPFPVSPDGLLQQSSTVADSVSFQFSDGITESVPCSYIEFAERFVLPQYENLPHTEVSSILSFKYHVLTLYCNSHLWFLWMRLDVCNHWSVFQFRTKLWTTLRIWMICVFAYWVHVWIDGGISRITVTHRDFCNFGASQNHGATVILPNSLSIQTYT